MTPDRSVPFSAHDGPDFFELIGNLWEQKWLIAAVTGLCTVAAIAYAFLVTPVYQASARILPPLSSDIAPLNQGRDQAGLPVLEVEDVYALVKRNLSSGNSRLWFFNEYYRPYREEQGTVGARDAMLAAMSDTLQVRQIDVRNNPELYSISVTLPGQPERAAEWTKVFLQHVSARTLSYLTSNTEGEVANRLNDLDQQAELLREKARRERLDRIAALREALIIANAVGDIRGSSVLMASPSGQGSADLYLRGGQAIRSEITLLEARENDDPFIPELRKLQQQREILTAINPSPEGANVFILDSPADTPDVPVMPKKKLVVAAGLVLGGILGIGIALLRIAVNRRRRARQ